jgi:hypothetical protein
MRMPKTHFEQIPVETVKKIAKELPESSTVPRLDEITPPQEHWQELAKQVQAEQDPNRLTELVTQLLVAFDERNPRKGSGSVCRNRPERI